MSRKPIKVTRQDRIYCLKTSSNYHSELCEECRLYPNCDHMAHDDMTEATIKDLELLEQDSCDKEEPEKILRKGMQQNEWIPVSERLPENGTPVLVTICIPDKYSVVRTGVYRECSDIFSSTRETHGYFFIDNGDTWEVTDTEVLAWMPTPMPYEAESED